MHDFSYISKSSVKVKETYNNILDILNEVQDLIRDKFTFSFTPVGSYSRNMITYDKKSNIGFDFDFNIEINDDDGKYTAKEIKNILINALNRVIKKYGYSYAENSTRVITIKTINYMYSKIEHSCDFATVNNYIENDCSMQEYIRFNKKTNEYVWCNQPKGYYRLSEKVEWLKENSLWNELRDYYILKKNTNNDRDIHSRTLFATSVHEICQKYGYKQQ